jgi:hypothetical protein
VGPRAPLLVVDKRPQHAIQFGVEALHHRVVLVQPRAVHPHHHLGSRRGKRLALERLDRLAAKLAVEMAGPGAALVADERRLMGGAAGADDEPAAAQRPRRVHRDRLGRPAHGEPALDPVAEPYGLVDEDRALGVGLEGRVDDQGGRLPGQRQPYLARRVLEYGSDLDEVGDERPQPRCGQRPPLRERNRDAGTAVEAEAAALVGPRCRIEEVLVDVGVVAGGGEEPRLDRPTLADPLDSSAALREPDVAQPASEEAALAAALR